MFLFKDWDLGIYNWSCTDLFYESFIRRGITEMAKCLVFPLFLSTLITILNLFTSKISKTTQF